MASGPLRAVAAFDGAAPVTGDAAAGAPDCALGTFDGAVTAFVAPATLDGPATLEGAATLEGVVTLEGAATFEGAATLDGAVTFGALGGFGGAEGCLLRAGSWRVASAGLARAGERVATKAAPITGFPAAALASRRREDDPLP